ncbi:M99 family carboxypeptidase catalytic domain-containing protein [Sulfurimonas sp.]|uniref:M99 family carboxypeptidase catalytic domain-containing protein n=1 Tax=Sulfurimonas sp. TaxID=2022749 RepID=UPI0025DE2782|nr:M99 family carboxypeptidase catalytic domain-containing protein [Sulfurimonas sp.]MDD5156558.1 M99 family carboxypeptidase catalytic domain-containing protein [Sulfurimonas sp.]
MKSILLKMLLVSIFFHSSAYAQIQLIKKNNNDSNTTLLVIGGIHGDEPGGYFAASILASHYRINSKNLWIVPNLNQESIQNNQRGINGDMNRKFSLIDDKDKDKQIIQEIKNIILDKNVSLILNLHDGHGFYRKTGKGSIFNPNAWGQTCVIDQCILNKDQPFGDLNKIALDIKNRINNKLIEDHHSFDVKNTNTKFEDEAMQLSLTYFSVNNNKPAFALESSKNLSTLSQKVFYHLAAIEEFMHIMGIAFSREFDLNEKTLDNIIKNYGILTINDNFNIDLSNIKKSLSFIPLKSKDNVFKFSSLLGSVMQIDDSFVVSIGNQKITTLQAQYFKMNESCMPKFSAIVDDKLISLNKASDIFAKDDLSIIKRDGYRVNIIGFTSKGSVDESGIKVGLQDMDKRFSVDEDGLVYRVEFYKNNEFCAMSKIHFKGDLK